jgi:hypothetical protein
MNYEKMNNADLLKVISALEKVITELEAKLGARRNAPVIYTVSTNFHKDLLRFVKGRRQEIWAVASKMGKPFTADDVLAAYKSLPSAKVETNDGGRGMVRLALNYLTSTGFLVAAKPEVKSKPEAKQLKTVAA